VTHAGLSLGTAFSFLGMMLADNEHPWKHHSARDVFLGRSSPLRVLSLSFGNGLIRGQFAQGVDVYQSAQGGFHDTSNMEPGVGNPASIVSRPAASYYAPYSNMTMRLSLLRLDFGAGVEYNAEEVTYENVTFKPSTGVFQFGIGLQFGTGLLSPFVSARYQSLTQVDSDAEIALAGHENEWTLVAGNTFDFHGLFMTGSENTTMSPFVDVGFVTMGQDSFAKPGSFFLTIGTKIQFATPWSITNDRSRERAPRP
jgi:hypothetical protein